MYTTRRPARNARQRCLGRFVDCYVVEVLDRASVLGQSNSASAVIAAKTAWRDAVQGNLKLVAQDGPIVQELRQSVGLTYDHPHHGPGGDGHRRAGRSRSLHRRTERPWRAARRTPDGASTRGDRVAAVIA
jgi:hypothetical protein